MSRLTRRPSPAMVVACLALLVALTGTSVAAVSQLVPRNSVGTAQLRDNAVARVKVRNNAINSEKVANRSLLAVDFARGQIPAGPAGRAGPTGPAGAAGPAGPAGTVTRLTAVVSATGTIARSQGTTSASRLSTGSFEVVFNQDIANCTYVADSRLDDRIAAPDRSDRRGYELAHERPRSHPRLGGRPSDLPFHLVVVC